MQVPNWAYRGRTAIEGLIPRNGAINAALHVGVGAATGVGVIAATNLFPKPDPSRPDRFDRADARNAGTFALTLAAAPLLLTAGMQLATPGGTSLAKGITPNYFLAAGALLGAGYIVQAADAALDS